METIGDLIGRIIGLDAEELNVGQMAVRAIVVYISALLMVRLGEKRFFGRNTAFDFILGIILGSVVSRAINGSAAFFPTLAAGLTLVLLHWLFSVLSFHSDWFGTFVKGNDRLLAENGAILWDAMRRGHLSEKDLMSSGRTQANVDDLEKVKAARLERSGDISVIKADASPKVLEVDVADGVQTVRIQIE